MSMQAADKYKCPICNASSNLRPIQHKETDCYVIDCPRCGNYIISDYAKDHLEKALEMNKAALEYYAHNPSNQLFTEVANKAINGKGINEPRSILSHLLRKMTNKQTVITRDILVDILKNNSLPKPAEQANNLVLFLGGYLGSPGASFEVPALNTSPKNQNIYGLIGIKTGNEWFDLHFIITSLEERQLHKRKISRRYPNVRRQKSSDKHIAYPRGVAAI